MKSLLNIPLHYHFYAIQPPLLYFPPIAILTEWTELIQYCIEQQEQEACEDVRATLVNIAEIMLGVALPFLFFSFSLCLGQGKSGWVASGMLMSLKIPCSIKGQDLWSFQKEWLFCVDQPVIYYHFAAILQSFSNKIFFF